MRLILACLLFSRGALDAQCVRGSRAQLDRTRPVPAKADVLDAWQRRQSAIHSFYFAWTELQTQPRGWIANPRYVERERLAAPSLEDRRYAVNKTLAVSRDSMRYSYTLDRRAEGETTGNSDRRHYSYAYESVFDGRRNVARATSLTDTPETTIRSNDNADAQNLDTRAILTALRPLDPILGDLLIDRAVPNLARTMYRGRSTFLLEERPRSPRLENDYVDRARARFSRKSVRPPVREYMRRGYGHRLRAGRALWLDSHWLAGHGAAG